MAKRKRLTAFGTIGGEGTTAAPSHLPPVARIAAEAATQAALDDLAAELRQARDSGRMVLDLPLDTVEATHLQRDRMHMDPEDMASLKASIRNRNQQMPIEVVALPDGRYGLVSGARRLAALTALRDETGDDRFATVKALLRPFEAAPEAYLAMVEENEIRADLSFYERGRLAHEAARLGVFDSPAAAVKVLFQHAPAPKRSKILSFVALHDALGDVLLFPEAIPEKLGLALVKAMQADRTLTGRLQDRLTTARPARAHDERSILEAALRPEPESKAPMAQDDAWEDIGTGVRMTARPGRAVLSGKGVTEDFLNALSHWLQSR
ncbi:ParB/RepB/Spo0J family partition protein [Paracoccus sediminis]|uniref:Chromosome partitioning protein, ParB family n=1 Tax=Paracoccus sediminis TaxID=1214787 RepID=A0A238Y7B8_9RHOB|nr:ParB N-terminal domain-containing protein [Paracoccus sediminis]SNR66543.1 chromosome partitioning protein, ParB family [Paracoccus sediminis]